MEGVAVLLDSVTDCEDGAKPPPAHVVAAGHTLLGTLMKPTALADNELQLDSLFRPDRAGQAAPHRLTPRTVVHRMRGRGGIGGLHVWPRRHPCARSVSERLVARLVESVILRVSFAASALPLARVLYWEHVKSQYGNGKVAVRTRSHVRRRPRHRHHRVGGCLRVHHRRRRRWRHGRLRRRQDGMHYQTGARTRGAGAAENIP